MRETFTGWYDPSTEDLEALWSKAMVVTDTNVLLDLYRSTPTIRKSLSKALTSVSDRLWIPHQVGLEFHKMRETVRSDSRKKQADLAKRISSDARSLAKQVTDLRQFNPAIDEDEALRSALRSAADNLSTELRERAAEYDEAEEVLLEQLDELFPEQRIGKPFHPNDLTAIRVEAADRFERRIPPGFADDGKSGDLRYGDYFLWKQLLERAAVIQTGVILVTRDEKEDWRKAGKVLPELAYEFFQATGSNIIVIHPDTLVRETLERGLWQAEEGEDVKQVSAEYQQVERAEAEHARASRIDNKFLTSAIRRALVQSYQANTRSALDVSRLTMPTDLASQVAASTANVDWIKAAAASAAAIQALSRDSSPEELSEDESEGDDPSSEQED